MGAGTREADRLAKQCGVDEEPLALKAGDGRVSLNGKPPLVDCRIVSEEVYQRLIARPTLLKQQTISDLMDERDKVVPCAIAEGKYCATFNKMERLIDKIASLQAKLAEYDEHTGTLGRSINLLKENNQLKDTLADLQAKLAEKERR